MLDSQHSCFLRILYIKRRGAGDPERVDIGLLKEAAAVVSPQADAMRRVAGWATGAMGPKRSRLEQQILRAERQLESTGL